ncbi:MAG: PLP-dependent transferase [Bacteroidota bacterium]
MEILENRLCGWDGYEDCAVTEKMIRLSVGVENTEDIIRDIEQAVGITN